MGRSRGPELLGSPLLNSSSPSSSYSSDASSGGVTGASPTAGGAGGGSGSGGSAARGDGGGNGSAAAGPGGSHAPRAASPAPASVETQPAGPQLLSGGEGGVSAATSLKPQHGSPDCGVSLAGSDVSSSLVASGADGSSGSGSPPWIAEASLQVGVDGGCVGI